MGLEVKDISYSYNEQIIFENISFRVTHGEFIGIIGPNGSGKSTLLKNLYRTLKPKSGTIFLDGKDLYKLTSKKVAKKIGVVGQENTVPFDFKVEEIVAMGRSPYKKLFSSDTIEDREIIKNSLRQIGMEAIANKNYSNLSGGEKQRVLIARVLAQQPEILILDEPTNHLDIHHQLQIFDLIKSLKLTVLAAIHDLNIAALYCDKIFVIKNGKIYKSGSPEEVLTSQLIYEVYGIQADITVHPITRKISVTYLPAGLHV